MKIAQVSPLFESVPPKTYGGTERVVSYLTEELVRQGHQVTLFACGDSHTRARLIAPVPHSARADANRPSWLSPACIELDMVAAYAAEFDVIHFHTDYLHFPLARRLGVPHLTTLHGRLDLPELQTVFHYFDDVPLVSISDQQRAPVPWAPWLGTVHHGLPRTLYEYGSGNGGHLAFVGRFSPEKGAHEAIEIALRTGMPIYMAAKIEDIDRPYYENRVAPLMNHPLVHYVGEVGESAKRELMAGASALLCPIDWPEPFGLVMIEALACGTPVIAYPHGSVPEIIEHGVTGFIVHDQDQAVDAVRQVAQLDRQRCRAAFEQRFSVEAMTASYMQLYRQLQRGEAVSQRMPHVADSFNHRQESGVSDISAIKGKSGAQYG